MNNSELKSLIESEDQSIHILVVAFSHYFSNIETIS